MAFRPDLLVPFGYGRDERTLGWVRTWLLEHHHPEFVERLVAWLDSKDGAIGPGGGWRAGGAQPNRPGFAPEGKSFHQDQNFADDFCGAAAVDLVARNGGLVHRSPRWSEVPAQHSADAARWGVHCNVGTPSQTGSEPWHVQPIEIDGWQTWWDAGRPAPVADYPFPDRFPPPVIPPHVPPIVSEEADPMIPVIVKTTDGAHYAAFGGPGSPCYHIPSQISEAYVFGRGNGRALDLGSGRVVSWSPDSSGSWAAAKAVLSKAQVFAVHPPVA